MVHIKNPILPQVRICYVVALPAEARPLLEAEKWTQIAVRPFRIYRTEHKAMIISGIGRIRAAAATAYLGGRVAAKNIPWINFGIAGHMDAPVGKGFSVSKITDRQERKNYYPLRIATKNTSVLSCFDLPQKEYPPNTLADMESAGFFPTASLFTYHELIHLYKVVSDNTRHAFQAEKVCSLVGEHLESLNEIGRIAGGLAERHLTQGNQMEQEVADWLDRAAEIWHIGFTERHALADVLRQWFVLRFTGNSQSGNAEDAGIPTPATDKELNSPFAMLDDKWQPIKEVGDFIGILKTELRSTTARATGSTSAKP